MQLGTFPAAAVVDPVVRGEIAKERSLSLYVMSFKSVHSLSFAVQRISLLPWLYAL